MPRKKAHSGHTGRTAAGHTRDLKVERIGKVTIYKRGETYHLYYRQGGITQPRKVEGRRDAYQVGGVKFILCGPGWHPDAGILIHGPDIAPVMPMRAAAKALEACFGLRLYDRAGAYREFDHELASQPPLRLPTRWTKDERMS